MKYEVELRLIRRSDGGSFSSSYEVHIINLTNEKAFDFIAETVTKGKTGWRRGLVPDDVFESNRKTK